MQPGWHLLFAGAARHSRGLPTCRSLRAQGVPGAGAATIVFCTAAVAGSAFVSCPSGMDPITLLWFRALL